MSDAATRRRNLRSLKLDPKTLQQRAGRTYSYWRDLLENEKKSFGEKAARSIEEDLGLPRGWLDRDASPDDKSAPDLSASLKHWRLQASARSIEVIDQLTVLAQKGALREEDWELLAQIVARFRRH